MVSSFGGNRIRMHLKGTQTRLSLLLGSADTEAEAASAQPLTRSALQNPDVSRYELERLLRRTEQRPDSGGWSRLFASTEDSCANSNAVT